MKVSSRLALTATYNIRHSRFCVLHFVPLYVATLISPCWAQLCGVLLTFELVLVFFAWALVARLSVFLVGSRLICVELLLHVGKWCITQLIIRSRHIMKVFLAQDLTILTQSLLNLFAALVLQFFLFGEQLVKHHEMLCHFVLRWLL